jgi:small subunit ribosomal protein S15
MAPVPVLQIQESGPYVAHGVTSSEAYAVLKTAPDVLASHSTLVESDPAAVSPSQQAEMVRRIISLENSSASAVHSFNKIRVMSMFGKHSTDSGSSSVQAALFTLKIKNMTEHLARGGGKDVGTKRALVTWMSKRVKILKYLRRKVCVW